MKEEVAEIIKSCRSALQKIGDNLQDSNASDTKLAVEKYETIKDIMEIAAALPRKFEKYQSQIRELWTPAQ